MKRLTIFAALAVTACVDHAAPPSAGTASSAAALYWSQGALLTATGLGLVADVSGTTVVAGLPNDNTVATQAGAVAVWVKSGSTWGPVTVVTDVSLPANALLGSAVSVDGNTLAAWASGQGTAGSVLVFVRSGATWTYQQTLQPTDGAAGDGFGRHLVVRGDTLAIASDANANANGTHAGAVYVYTRIASTWALQQKLTGSQSLTGASFGVAVALSGDTLAVSDANVPLSTAQLQPNIYVYQRAGAVWSEQQRFLAPMGSTKGLALALDVNTLVLPYRTVTTNVSTVNLYFRTGTTWALQQTIAGLPNGLSGAVGVRGDVTVFSNGSTTSYVYERSGTTWTQQRTLTGSGWYGQQALGVDTARFVVPAADGVHVYESQAFFTNGTACTENAACASNLCVDGVCCSTSCNAGSTTDCQACSVAAGGTLDGTCTAIPGPRACDDGSLCTSSDSCQSGVCVGTPSVTCTALDVCHDAGTCVPATGLCPNPIRANGTNCNDGNACTQTDSCNGGVCTGSNPVACPMPASCRVSNGCNTTTGACTVSVAVEGAGCNDGNGCTVGDYCTGGNCVSGGPLSCTPFDECHAAAACQSPAGTCGVGAPLSGTACSGGTCAAGVCVLAVDAGVADSGVPDAGAADAGVQDAGVQDAGAADAGAADAGVQDAGVGDAGVQDAGAVDSGVLDAGVLDAGVLDAGAEDAGVSQAPDAGPSTNDPGPANAQGCGCGAAPPSELLLLAVGALGLVARRRRAQ
jgi:MYXO-CTERM domain-containing protein